MSELNSIDAFLNSDDDEELPDAEEIVVPDPEPDETSSDQVQSDGAGVTDRGDGRDAQGRFAPKEGEAPEPVTSTTEGAVVPDATAVTPTPAAESVSGQADEVFFVKYGNQEFEIPGSKVTAEGVFIPTAQRGLVSEFIGKGVKLDAERAQIKQARMVVQHETSVAQAKAKAFEGEVTKLFEIAQIPDEQQFAEAILAYGLELREKYPLLQREMELAEREAKLQLQQQVMRPDADEQQVVIEREIASTIQSTIAEFKAHERFKGMTEQDWVALSSAIDQDRGTYFYRAGQRLTAEEQAAGINPGDPVFNQNRAIREADRIVGWRRELTQEREAKEKAIREAEKIANANAKKLAAAQPAKPTAKPKPNPTRQSAQDDDDEDDDAALTREFTALIRR